MKVAFNLSYSIESLDKARITTYLAKKRTQMKVTLSTLVVFTSICSPLVLAGDIAQDIRTGSELERENGGYFGVGLSVAHVDGGRIFSDDDEADAYLGISLGGTYYYNGLFIEASQGTSDGLNIGYNFLNKGNWSVDFIALSFQGRLETEDDDREKSLNENERNDAMLERNTFYNGAGIRATANFDDYIFQYRLVTDIHGGNGIVSTARIGRSWQIQNWNLHSILSMEYSSSETNSYLYGVTEQEATSRFAEYDLGSSLKYSGEVGVTYPLSEHTVFTSFVRYTDLPQEIEDSPLMKDGNETLFVTSISYIF